MGVCRVPNNIRIVCMIALGLALIMHLAAFAAPRWDSFIANPKNIQIKVTQNLWGFKDDSHVAYKNYNSVVDAVSDETWKEDIIVLMGIAIGSGLVAFVGIVTIAVVSKFMNNKIQYVMLMTVAALCGTSCGLCLWSALRYKDRHLTTLSRAALKPYNMVPYWEWGMDLGYYICLVASGMYGACSAIAVGDIIKTVVLQFKKPSIVPSKRDQQWRTYDFLKRSPVD